MPRLRWKQDLCPTRTVAGSKSPGWVMFPRNCVSCSRRRLSGLSTRQISVVRGSSWPTANHWLPATTSRGRRTLTQSSSTTRIIYRLITHRCGRSTAAVSTRLLTATLHLWDAAGPPAAALRCFPRQWAPTPMAASLLPPCSARPWTVVPVRMTSGSPH